MDKPLEFERVIDGVAELWQVDDSLWRDADVKKRNPIAVRLRISLAKRPLFGAEGRLKKALSELKASAEKENAAFAACCVSKTYCDAVLYCATMEHADKTAACLDKPRLTLDAQCYSDPDWVVFTKEIYPDMALLQAIKNDELAVIHKKRGDDITVPRRISHHLAFPDELSRLNFCEEARQAGFALGDSSYSTEGRLPHSTSVCRICSLSKEDIDGSTASLIRLAQKQNGEYLYWDCQIINTKNRF